MSLRRERLSRSSLEGLKKSSVIRKIFLLGQERKKADPSLDIIDLSLGNPDLDPPPEVHEGLKRLLARPEPGVHRYMDNAGFPDVRRALAAELSQSERVDVGQSSLFLTCGAAGALHILMKALLNPGDEVLLMAPYFVEYTTYVAEHQATCRVVPLEETDSFVPRLAAIQKALQANTRMLILNSPNNPSGVVYPPEFYRGLAHLLREEKEKHGRDIHVVSDEPYARVVFEGHKHASVLAEIPGSWLVRSHSKDLGLAGERIGYIAWERDGTDVEVLDALRSSARALGFVNAPALMQRLLPAVFQARVNTALYQQRVVAFCRILQKGGVEVVQPGGTFFVLPKVPTGFSDEAFCEALAEKGVLVVPARAFGAPGYFRASLTQSQEKVEKAAHVIVEIATSRPS